MRGCPDSLVCKQICGTFPLLGLRLPPWTSATPFHDWALNCSEKSTRRKRSWTHSLLSCGCDLLLQVPALALPKWKNYDLELWPKIHSPPPTPPPILAQQQKWNRVAPVTWREWSFHLSAQNPILSWGNLNNPQNLLEVPRATRTKPRRPCQTLETKKTGLKAMWGPGIEKQMLGTNYINPNIAQAFVNIVYQHWSLNTTRALSRCQTTKEVRKSGAGCVPVIWEYFKMHRWVWWYTPVIQAHRVS